MREDDDRRGDAWEMLNTRCLSIAGVATQVLRNVAGDRSSTFRDEGLPGHGYGIVKHIYGGSVDVQEDLEALFDRYAKLVRDALSASVGLVTLLEPARQRFVGAVGLPAYYQDSRETPLTHSFCQYVVQQSKPLIVADARLVPELADSLAIPDLQVVAYAGWPISQTAREAPRDAIPGTIVSEIFGVLCAIDSEPRDWTSKEVLALCDLARSCAEELVPYLAEPTGD